MWRSEGQNAAASNRVRPIAGRGKERSDATQCDQVGDIDLHIRRPPVGMIVQTPWSREDWRRSLPDLFRECRTRHLTLNATS